MNDGWIKRNDGDKVVFYNAGAIEEFGTTSYSPIGRIVRIRESDTRVVKLFMTDDEIDEIFYDLDIRRHARLAAVGYITPDERAKSSKAMSDLLKRTSE